MKQSAGQKTKLKILNAGVKLWPDTTLTKIADECNLTHAAVLYHFPKSTLRDAIAAHAVDVGESRIIIQLIGDKDPIIDGLSKGERAAHFFST